MSKHNWKTDEELLRVPPTTDLEEELRVRLIRSMETVEEREGEIMYLEEQVREMGECL